MNEVKRVFEIPTDEEIEKLINNASGELLIALHLACYSGLRINEILNLKVSHIDLQKRKIYVEKGKYGSRYVLIKKETKTLLQYNITEKALQYNDKLITTSYRTIHNHLLRLSDKLKIQKKVKRAGKEQSGHYIHWHVLRHYCYTTFVKSGASEKFLKAQFGHISAKTGEIYNHTAIEQHINMYDKAWG